MKRAVYTIIAVDVALAFCLAVVSRFAASVLVLGLGFPILLTFNYLYLRRSIRVAGSSTAGQTRPTPRDARSHYAAAAIFLGGTLYGLAQFFSGQMPLTVLPVLVVPLSLGPYMLRTARRK